MTAVRFGGLAQVCSAGGVVRGASAGGCIGSQLEEEVALVSGAGVGCCCALSTGSLGGSAVAGELVVCCAALLFSCRLGLFWMIQESSSLMLAMGRFSCMLLLCVCFLASSGVVLPKAKRPRIRADLVGLSLGCRSTVGGGLFSGGGGWLGSIGWCAGG